MNYSTYEVTVVMQVYGTSLEDAHEDLSIEMDALVDDEGTNIIMTSVLDDMEEINAY